jgi:hypothetical protein
MAINDDDTATSNCFHFITACYQHTGIFPQTNTNTARVGCHSLCKSSKPSTFFKMAVDDNIIYKSKASSDLNFAF